MISVYSLKIYDVREARDMQPRVVMLRSEEYFFSESTARHAARGEPHWALLMYDVKSPINVVALLNRVNCFNSYMVLEDRVGMMGGLVGQVHSKPDPQVHTPLPSPVGGGI